MQIRLNGEPFEVKSAATVLELVLELELDPKSVAVERNLEIVPKSRHGEESLTPGDSIEIVEFVGGG
ncbi:sulfur carrier protein ThiS [Ponticaulis sp.]|uniref:sulfur carrier protein ThiS n=1 Tax=Ponticaulis sp. TaxID=2020902 RepID=UPI000B742FFF|nr:thiamine biosynthesis protein ThiS [Ponticaulis sp.]OUX96221.1 MAG: thiamine biosynthesis protein ThiS [Hyphomonadaceae bacterium TMED5]